VPLDKDDESDNVIHNINFDETIKDDSSKSVADSEFKDEADIVPYT